MCPAVWLSHPCPSVSQGQHQKVPAEGGEVPGEAVGAGKLLWGWRGVVVPHLPALLGQGASTLEEGEQFYDSVPPSLKAQACSPEWATGWAGWTVTTSQGLKPRRGSQ